MQDTNTPLFITKKEVAELLRCSIGTVNNLMAQGKIHSYGYNRLVIFKKDEIINGLIKR